MLKILFNKHEISGSPTPPLYPEVPSNDFCEKDWWVWWSNTTQSWSVIIKLIFYFLEKLSFFNFIDRIEA